MSTERRDPNIENVLKQAIKINSAYPNEEEISRFYEEILTDAGFTVERQDVDKGRQNILATKGSGERAILFYGHMDTVHPVRPDSWKYGPFNPTLEEGRLYGLGSIDTKAGIVAAIEATKDSSAYTKIFLAVDEENISEGAWKAVREREDFFEDVELIVSVEANYNPGLNILTTGRTGRCVYEINFAGKAEHIIKYKEGVDAIKKLCDFGAKLYEEREDLFTSEDTVAQIRHISGEAIGMSVPAESTAEVEVLLGAEDSVESVRLTLQDMSEDEVKLKPRKTPYLEGYNFDNFPYQDLIAKIIKNHTGGDMQLIFEKTVGDDNVLATLKIPVIAWGAEGDNKHTIDEYVVLESVYMLCEMYKDFLEEFSNKKGEGQ